MSQRRRRRSTAKGASQTRSVQKGHGGKRPRRFHRGIVEGKLEAKRMDAELLPAYARAEADRVEVARVSSEHKAKVRDYESLLAGLARVSPCAPRPLPLVLL